MTDLNFRKLERWIPWAVGVVLALPTLLVAYPPMADLPLHEAVVAMLRNWGDPAFRPAEVYQLNFGHPNQLFYFLALLLSYPLGTTWGCKLVVAASIVFMPVAGASLATHLRRTRLTAPLVAPLALGWLYYWGLIANMLSISVLLWAIIVFDRQVKRPSPAGAAKVFGFLVLLSYCHEAAMLCGCVIYGIGCITRDFRWRPMLLRFVPLVLMALVTLWHLRASKSIARYVAVASEEDTLLHKLQVLSGVLVSGFEDWVRNLLFGFLVASALAFLVLRIRNRPKLPRSERIPRWRMWLFAYRMEIAALVIFACYWIFPQILSGATLVYHRFLPIAWALFAIIVAPPRTAKPQRVAVIAAIAIPLAVWVVHVPQFIQADGIYRDFDSLMPRIERGSPVFLSQVSPRGDELYTMNTLAGHMVAMRGGRTAFDYTQSVLSPVYVTNKCDWPLSRDRLIADTREFRPAYDMRRFRYVIFFAREFDAQRYLEEAMRPEGHFVASKGYWYLFESSLKVRPICSHDWKLADPPPDRVIDRLERIVAKENGLDLSSDAGADGGPRRTGDAGVDSGLDAGAPGDP